MDSIAIETCKCCGAVIPPTVKLPNLKMRIYKFIGKHPDCTIDALVKELYEFAYDGGPIDPKHAIREQIRKMRETLAASGMTIICGKGNLYRLERLA